MTSVTTTKTEQPIETFGYGYCVGHDRSLYPGGLVSNFKVTTSLQIACLGCFVTQSLYVVHAVLLNTADTQRR